MSVIVKQFQTVRYIQINDEFDLWPVYSGERFRAIRPSCQKLGFEDNSMMILV